MNSRRLLGASVLVLTLAGCGGGGHNAADHAGGGSSTARATASGSAAASSAPAAAFNQQDVSFAQNMIMHHRQALDMAALVETRGASTEVRNIADSVAASQAPEVDLMSRWLTSWGAQIPEDMSTMDMSGSMPGMQSLTDLAALSDLDGPAFDQKFLAMMKDHHEGAITMAQQQVAKGRNPEAQNLASQVILEQSAEISLISSLLK